MAEDKILKEEILDDAELEGVAGGTSKETLDDKDHLLKMGLYKFDSKKGFAGSVADAIAKLGKNIGVDLNVSVDINMSKTQGNKYFIGGSEASRDEFWSFINEVYDANKK